MPPTTLLFYNHTNLVSSYPFQLSDTWKEYFCCWQEYFRPPIKVLIMYHMYTIQDSSSPWHESCEYKAFYQNQELSCCCKYIFLGVIVVVYLHLLVTLHIITHIIVYLCEFFSLGVPLCFPHFSSFYVTIIIKVLCSLFLSVLVHIVFWYKKIWSKTSISTKLHFYVISSIFYLFLSFFVKLFLLSYLIVLL